MVLEPVSDDGSGFRAVGSSSIVSSGGTDARKLGAAVCYCSRRFSVAAASSAFEGLYIWLPPAPIRLRDTR